MFIGIDGNEANTTQKVGSNVYASNLLDKINSADNHTNYQIYLKSQPKQFLPKPAPNWQYKVIEPKLLWTQWRLPLELFSATPRPKVFFTPGHYSPRFSPVPTAISIMDLAFIHYPNTFKPIVRIQLTNWTAYSVNKAAHIFTISESTKRDIIKQYDYPKHQITVTYPGPNLTTPKNWTINQKNKTKQKFKIPGKYIVFIGTRQPRKNLKRLIKAFNLLATKNTYLIIIGKKWHQFSEEHFKTNNQIIVTGYLPKTDVARLLLSSEGLVLPSLYEGFGLPVLEAMRLGIPVAASNTTSIPEITGPSKLLFNPRDVNDIAQKIEILLTLDQSSRQKIVQQGKITAKQFTWENCTKKTLEVLHELAI